MNTQAEHTPLMQQYHEIKAHYQDTLLLFQVGDFYELFFDDAKKAAAFLGIALTARGKNKGEPIPLCGVPVHARDYYLAKLIKGGFNVAICDQLEQATPGTLVQRGITQVLTPGTLTDPKLLDEKSASYLCTFIPAPHSWGLLFGELLTAQLYATIIPIASEKTLDAELIRFFPDEILLPTQYANQSLQAYFKQRGYCTTLISDDICKNPVVNTWIQTQFTPEHISTIQMHESLALALHYFYAYMHRNQINALAQFHTLHFYKTDDFLILDAATQRNLELVKNVHDGNSKHTLFAIIDGAITPMGSRLIKKWLLRPLVNHEAIAQRYDVIDFFLHNIALREQIQEQLNHIGDIERTVGRIALQKAPIHDYQALAHALGYIPILQALLQPYIQIPLIRIITEHLGNFELLTQLLAAAFDSEISEQRIIKKGFNEQLDHLRELIDNSQQKIIELERNEQEKTGISSLKIRFNQLYGYYIEITKPNIPLVPHYYTRQQTLVGKERYTIPALQQVQYDIDRAHKEYTHKEREIFEYIKNEITNYITALRKCVHAVAHLDALIGLATTAHTNKYVRPTFNHDTTIIINNGRHPVVEHTVGYNNFIPNDTHIVSASSLWIITGPNMGGKSTYLRQVALICILAQCGSFVPATQAHLFILDRVFTRIGAGDNVAQGKSTFLIEMEETATICAYATNKSLIILDEVGRGTSTYDGLALAHAIIEYIHCHLKTPCLFATHYHELTQLRTQYPGIVCYYTANKKTDRGIVFLYKMLEGVADGSFGIEVAKLAQLPLPIITRAQQLITELSPTPLPISPVQKYDNPPHHTPHLNIIHTILTTINYNELSPKQAFDILWKLRELAQE